jgi:hypothetical protein
MSHNNNNNNNCNKHLIEQGSIAAARACSADLYEPIEIRSADNCYELNPGSSLRVRFRMITHQSSRHANNHAINNNRRINSTTSSISTASSSVIHSTSMSPANISPDSTIPPPAPQNHNKIFLSHQSYQQKINETVSNYNNPNHSQSPCIIYNKYINQNKQQNVHININPNSQGSSSSSSSSTSSSSTTHRSTTRTFKLTEDLKSNIRFDITLKPTLSIRDNRIDPSSTSKSNSSFNIHNSNGCNLTTRSTSCDTRNFNSNNEIELPIIKTSPTSSHKSVPPSNHVPLNSSITFKIKNIELNDNNMKTNNNNNNTDQITRTSSKRNSNRYNSQSPFTFIETYSARRGISLSPNSINNERILYSDSKKVN